MNSAALDRIASIATEIAPKHAFEKKHAYSDHVFHYAPRVTLRRGDVLFSVDVTGYVSRKEAGERLLTFWNEVIEALKVEFGDELRVDGLPLQKRRSPHGKGFTWAPGLWHMGSFSADAVCRAIMIGRAAA